MFTVPTCAEDGLKVDLLETVKKLDALHARSRRADEAGVPRRVLVYCMSGQSRAPSVAADGVVAASAFMSSSRVALGRRRARV